MSYFSQDPNRYLFITACLNGNPATAKLLMAANQDIGNPYEKIADRVQLMEHALEEIKYSVAVRDQDGLDQFKAIIKLLDPDKSYLTEQLYIAAMTHDENRLKVLIDGGADINQSSMGYGSVKDAVRTLKVSDDVDFKLKLDKWTAEASAPLSSTMSSPSGAVALARPFLRLDDFAKKHALYRVKLGENLDSPIFEGAAETLISFASRAGFGGELMSQHALKHKQLPKGLERETKEALLREAATKVSMAASDYELDKIAMAYTPLLALHRDDRSYGQTASIKAFDKFKEEKSDQLARGEVSPAASAHAFFGSPAIGALGPVKPVPLPGSPGPDDQSSVSFGGAGSGAGIGTGAGGPSSPGF